MRLRYVSVSRFFDKLKVTQRQNRCPRTMIEAMNLAEQAIANSWGTGKFTYILKSINSLKQEMISSVVGNPHNFSLRCTHIPYYCSIVLESLNLVVCILLRVVDQVQGFPSNATLSQQLFIILFKLSTTCFGLTTIFRRKCIHVNFQYIYIYIYIYISTRRWSYDRNMWRIIWIKY
jgi:hypothetical protein